MFKKIISLVAIFVFMILSTGVAFAQRTVEFDTSDVEKGIVRVMYENPDVSKAKFMIQKGAEKKYLNLSNNGNMDTFTLPYGNGEYQIAVYENIYSTKYIKIYSETVSFTAKEEVPEAQVKEVVVVKETKVKEEVKVSAPEVKVSVPVETKTVAVVPVTGAVADMFLQSTEEINFNDAKEAVRIAKELTKDAKSDEEKALIIHKFVTEKIVYDFQKINRLQLGYMPTIDTILADGKGICYDYAAVYAGMLRSVGVPTKLIKGYSAVTPVYHAWNEVLINGKWVIVDTTYDAYMVQNGYNYSFSKDLKYYTMTKES